jgi:hypothetical protein
MPYKRLTTLGEEHIKEKCKGKGNSNLKGKNDYVLPFTPTPISPDRYWTSNPDINGGIETNDELAKAIINWYNKYAALYNVDANIIAAQAYIESGYKVWNYAPFPSSASGISQFTYPTIYDVIIDNKFKGMNGSDIKAITKGMIDYTYKPDEIPSKKSFIQNNSEGLENRIIIFQNIIDNPEIMIKAQCVYMDEISKKCDDLASCTLFGYSRGPYLLNEPSSSYTIWINAAKRHEPNYELEGINYVYKIFKLLYDRFGYKQLNITEEGAKNFDKFFGTLG